MSNRRLAREYEARRRADQRVVMAIAIAYVGTLVALAASERIPVVLFYALMAGAGAAAAALLGQRIWPATLGHLPRPDMAVPALATAVGMLGAGLFWMIVISVGGPGAVDWTWRGPSVDIVFTFVLLPALVEEWVCRGVLWEACRRLTNVRNTIIVTAVLFGLMHVLTWGAFGFPSRAVGGLLLGILRARTGSLAPCIVAHGINNAVAAGWL